VFPHAFKTDVLVMMIREERASGKIPMTELELKIYKDRKKDLKEKKLLLKNKVNRTKAKDVSGLFTARLDTLTNDVSELDIDTFNGEEATVIDEKLDNIIEALKG